MPDKAYAILLSMEVDEEGYADNGYIYFPIKRDNLVYGGMPQFFGGTKNAGESDRETIAREMYEESDNKITLEAGGLTSVYHTQVGMDNYNFYIATNFSGQHFLGDLENNEMASIQKFFVQVGQDDGVEDMLQSLGIVPSLAFSQSETYIAFGNAIGLSEEE